MTEAQAKKQLRQMLRSMTAGSVLHLLSELFTASSKRAQRKGDDLRQKQYQEVAAALFVLGLGIDSMCPR